jgi:putative flippase GtrA
MKLDFNALLTHLQNQDLRSLQRFFKYALVGGSTFAFDLLLLTIFTGSLHWDPVWSAGIAFLIAVSINYLISRKFVFKGTLRSVHAGYGGFLLIGGCGLAIVTGGMYLLVNVLEWNFVISRVLIAFVTGTWNYLLNLYVNFRVAGKHL